MIADPQALMVHSREPDETGATLHIDVERAGWEYTGLRVLRLSEGTRFDAETASDEVAIVLLGGDCQISTSDGDFRLDSRPSIFEGPPSGVYIPIGSSYTVSANDTSEIAICTARAEESHPVRAIDPGDVAVEIRGAGNAARQINHIIAPGFPAHRLLVVEVFTPSGNWSSYPPHKHDESRMPEEADLEEIYYYRIEPNDGFAFQRLHTADGSVDQPYIVRDGDALMIPEGYHSFAVAHGYTGYYLNVLAGNESIRTMQPFDDPAYGWVRATWSDDMNEGLSSWQDIDQRINGAAGRRTPG
jgi:5-deoxy-glucuronate isomerase